MPFVVKHSGGPEYKKVWRAQRISLQAKSMGAGRKDAAMLRENSTDEFLVLHAMPTVLHIEMEKGLKEPYPNLPEDWFR